MITRLVRLCALAAFLSIAAAQAAQAPATPPAVAIDDNTVRELKLHNVDIDTMLETLEKLTGRIILRPAALQTAPGYTLRIDRAMPKAEAIRAIETVLALNNISIAPQGDDFFVVTNSQQITKEAPQMITGSALDLPPSGRVATKLFQLEFARVDQVLPILAGVLNGLYGGPVMLQHANAAFITDSIRNLQRVETILKEIDKPSPGALKPKFFNVRNVKATDLVNKIKSMLTGPLTQTLGTGTTYTADDRTQQVVVFADPRLWDFFAEMIDKLDQRSDPNTRIEVLYLKNAKAVDVVNVLSKFISTQSSALQRQNQGSVRPTTPTAPGTPPAPGPAQPAAPTVVSASMAGNDPNASNEFSSFMTVVNDDRSNSVVVFGTSDDIRLVRTLVDQLDIRLPQVRIEVVIADVTLDDNHQSGISTLGLKIDGNKLVGFSGTTPTVNVANGTITRPGGDLAADISIGTSPRKRNNVILTQPSTVTSHGKEAKFFTGETRPVVTGTVNSAAGATSGLASSSQYTQQKIGTTLTVTPFIGANNSVQLEITQSVEDVTGTVKVDANDQYIIGQRESKSYISAMSGDILVFSGFTKATNINETNRLGPIPILGELLGSRRKASLRSELIFFVRATVIVNDPAVDNAETMKRIEQMPGRDAIKGAINPNYQPAK